MTDMTVSQTILSQLGGNRFIAMTGSKNFVGSDDALSFKLVPNQSKAKYMRIVLTSMDGKRGRTDSVSEIDFCTLYVVAERWILACMLRFVRVKNDFSDTLRSNPRSCNV